MLDIRFIRSNPDAVRRAAELKRIPFDVDALLTVDAERRRLLQTSEEMKAKQNRTSKQIATLRGEERDQRIREMQELVATIKQMTEQLKGLETEFDALMLQVPNIPADEVPAGESEADNVEIRRWGTPRQFDFEFQDHVTLGNRLGIPLRQDTGGRCLGLAAAENLVRVPT